MTCLELAAIAQEVGLPGGVLNVITGLGAEAGAPLTYVVFVFCFVLLLLLGGCCCGVCGGCYTHHVSLHAHMHTLYTHYIRNTQIQYPPPPHPPTPTPTHRCNPIVAKVAFTGSVATGRRVALAAAQMVRPCSLELGGKSALLVFDDADVDKAVEWAMVRCVCCRVGGCRVGTSLHTHISTYTHLYIHTSLHTLYVYTLPYSLVCFGPMVRYAVLPAVC